MAAKNVHSKSTKGLQSHSLLVCKQMCYQKALSSVLQCCSAVRWTLCLPVSTHKFGFVHSAMWSSEVFYMHTYPLQIDLQEHVYTQSEGQMVIRFTVIPALG